MWTREELKTRGKAAFLRNYWICVVAALILTLLVGSGTSNSGNSNNDKKYNAAEDSKNKFNRSKRGESFCKGFHIEVIGRNRKSRYTDRVSLIAVIVGISRIRSTASDQQSQNQGGYHTDPVIA